MTHTHEDPMSLHDSNWPPCLDGVVHCPFWSGLGLQGNNVIALDKNEGSTFTPLLKDDQSQGAAREGLAMLGMIRTWYRCSWQDDMEGSDKQLPCTRLMYRLQNTWLIPEGALFELIKQRVHAGKQAAHLNRCSVPSARLEVRQSGDLSSNQRGCSSWPALAASTTFLCMRSVSSFLMLSACRQMEMTHPTASILNEKSAVWRLL